MISGPGPLSDFHCLSQGPLLPLVTLGWLPVSLGPTPCGDSHEQNHLHQVPALGTDCLAQPLV